MLRRLYTPSQLLLDFVSPPPFFPPTPSPHLLVIHPVSPAEGKPKSKPPSYSSSSRATVYFLLHMPCSTLNAPRNLPASIFPQLQIQVQILIFLSISIYLAIYLFCLFLYFSHPHTLISRIRRETESRTCSLSIHLHNACHSVYGRPSSSTSWPSSSPRRARAY